MTSTIQIQEQQLIEEVRTQSDNWIAAFNRGDVDTCVAGYQPDAVMEAKPMGTFTGHNAIDGFWRPFLAAGASDLIYSNRRFQVVCKDTILLAADWTMNVGRGIITEERWIRCEDGIWRLSFDAFEIQEQYQK